MTTTGRNYGLTINEWVDERRDPVKSTRAAVAYLKDLYLWFNNWDFALAAYNRGEGGIHRDIQKSRIADFMEMAELGATHTETQNHVPQIHAAAIIAKHPEKYGFKLVDNPIQADTVVIDYVVDLELVAECVGATERDLRELNPELRTWITPVLSVDYPTYTLKLPPGTADHFRTQIAQHEDKTPRRQMTYVVRKGDTLGGIAHKFGVGTTDLKRWNNLKSSRIRRGQKLVVIPDRDKVRTSREVVADASSGAGTSSGATAGSGGGQGSSDTLIHTVQRGDTLYDIALRYGTSVGELRRLNGLSSKGKIYPGQKLKVQDGNSD
jgi:membrane-bound lytic murein transglycosylase D